MATATKTKETTVGAVKEGPRKLEPTIDLLQMYEHKQALEGMYYQHQDQLDQLETQKKREVQKYDDEIKTIKASMENTSRTIKEMWHNINIGQMVLLDVPDPKKAPDSVKAGTEIGGVECQEQLPTVKGKKLEKK